MYIDVYQDKANQWRWRFRGGNNETMADSGEGYQERMDMFRALEMVTGGWTGLISYFDAAGEKQEATVLSRVDGTSIPIRDKSIHS